MFNIRHVFISDKSKRKYYYKGMIKVLDNFFPSNMYNEMLKDSKNNWQNKEYFIYKDLTEKLYTIDVINYMSFKLDKNITLYRAYSHGHQAITRTTYIKIKTLHTLQYCFKWGLL